MKKRLLILTIMAIAGVTLIPAQNDCTSDPAPDGRISTNAAFIAPTDSNRTYVDIIADWYDRNMNYLTITALMTIESSFIPFPSEIVVPPAAAVSTRPNSQLNILLIILFASLGAILGALINYFISMTLGRAIIYKFADSRLGRLCLLNSDKIRRAEQYFNDHGKVSTFVGRLVPGIRQLISIPAGLARMPLLPFIGYTALGAGIWNGILAAIGYAVGDNMELINRYSHEIGYTILAIIVAVILGYALRRLAKRNK